MSKRASVNAIRFSGNPWDKVKRSGSKKKKVSKVQRNTQRRDKIRLDKLEKICQRFGFERTQENEEYYQQLHKLFIETVGVTELRDSLTNIKYYKHYCMENNISFDIKTYFNGKYYKRNFPKT